MKKNTLHYLLSILLFFTLIHSENTIAQGTTFQSANFPGSARKKCMAATVGHKGYLMLGFIIGGIYINDVWEYDEVSSIWTQKNNFPGITRQRSFTWSINGEIYLGCGENGATCFSDVWKYSPATDSWLQVASFPGNNRGGYASFTYNNKGYIAFGAISCFSNTGSDQFWEYDPITDSWTQLLSPPSTALISKGSVVNDKVIFLDQNNTNTLVYNFTSSTWETDWLPAGGISNTGPLFACTLQGVVHIFNGYSPKYLDTTSRAWFNGDTLYNSNFHDEMAFMAFADSVKMIGGGDGTFPLSSHVWTYYAGCTSSVSANFSVGDSTYFGTTNKIINTSSISPSGSVYAFHWQIDTSNLGWFRGDTSFIARKIGDYTITLIAENGYCSDSVSKSIHVNQGMWSAKTALPLEAHERSNAIGASIADDAVVGMGEDYSGTSLRDLWKYNSITHRLTRLRDFPFSALKYPEFISANGKYYLLGGNPGFAPYKSNKFYVYDPVVDVWTALPDFPGAARVYPKALSINNDIYLSFGVTNELWRYNILSSSWTQLTSHPSFNYVDELLEYRGNLLAITLGSQSSIWQYTISTDSWGLYTSNFASDNRFGSNIYLSGDKLWIVCGKFSGAASTDYLNSSYYYDLITGAISQGPSNYVFSYVFLESAFATGFMIGNSYYRCFGESFGGYKDKSIARYESNACINIPYYYPYEMDEAGIGIAHGFANTSRLYLPVDSSGFSLFVDGVEEQVGVNSSYGSKTFSICGEHKLQWVINRSGCSDTTTYYQTAHPIFRLVPRAEMPLGATFIRHTMNSFSLGQTGFMGMGNKYVEIFLEAYKDWYAYDPLSDSWSVKASLPAGADNHTGSACFTNGTFGYISSGSRGCFPGANCYLSDTYQYDPILDNWTSKSNMPGVGRYIPIATVIGDTAYAGLGYYPFFGGGQIDKYNFTTDSWTSSGWPYGASMSATSTAFTYNGKVYAGYEPLFGGGSNPGLYEYNPSTGRWSGLLPMYGSLRGQRFAKQVGNEVYLFSQTVSKLDMDRMKLIPLQTLANPGDTSNEFSAAFSINNQVYLSLLNLDNSPRLGNHFYRYDLDQPVCDIDSLILGVARPNSSLPQLLISPNPVTELTTIRFSNGKSLNGLLELYDMKGSLITTKECHSVEIQLDISKQNKGSYFCIFTDKISGLKKYCRMIVM